MRNNPHHTSEARIANEAVFSIDMNALVSYIRSRLWLVLVIVAACETLAIAAGLLVTPEFRAEALVRMAKIENTPGEQGKIIAQALARLPAEQVKLAPRPQANTVLVSSSGRTPEEAKTLAEKATEVLIEEGSKAVKARMTGPSTEIELIEKELAKLDSNMRRLFSDAAVGKGNDPLLALRRETTLSQLMIAQSSMYAKVMERKLDIQRAYAVPTRIGDSHSLPQQTRPRWGRNLVLAAVFGTVFGVFIVGLMGFSRQISVSP
jgi:hypothetical protein